MISKELLREPTYVPTIEKLRQSHIELYDVAEASRAITTTDDWLDLEELEETVDGLKKEVSLIQQDLYAIKLQLTTKQGSDPLWEIKANKALAYKGKLLCRYQQTLSEKNTELKQLRRVISTNNALTVAREIMSEEQWREFIAVLTNRPSGMIIIEEG